MRRWLILTAACGLGFFAALLALVLATDVFGLFGTRIVQRAGVAPQLRLTTSGDRTIKALEIAQRREPLDIVFLGSSRVAFAFDPDAPVLSGLRAFNAGLHGSHSNETAAVLHYVVDHGPPVRRFVWNVDFEEFYREAEGGGDFAQSGFAGASNVAGLLRHALSYEALRKSMALLFGGQAFYMDVSGFYHYGRQAAANLANGRDSDALPTLRDWFPQYMFQPEDRFATERDERFARIMEAIRYARSHGVAVDIVCMPSHVARRALFDRAGLQPKFEEWKRRLAAAVAEAAEGPGAPVRAFDFSEAGEIARAAFRPGGPLDRSPLFFEVLHPKPIVAETILARLLDRAPPLSAEPGLGDPLAETARPERLTADLVALRRWEAENPRLVEEITLALTANDHRRPPPSEAAPSTRDERNAALDPRAR